MMCTFSQLLDNVCNKIKIQCFTFRKQPICYCYYRKLTLLVFLLPIFSTKHYLFYCCLD